MNADAATFFNYRLFGEQNNSYRGLISRHLIFRWRIEKLFLFNCSDMDMKFSTEKYGESVC